MTPVEIARTYLGVKWVHQGRARHGLDCIGLIQVAFSGYGLPDWTDYGQDPHDGLLEKRAAAVFGPPVSKESLQPGDVVLMAFPRVVRHVGIVGDHRDGLSLIHTDASLKRVTEHRLDERWLRRIRFVHRMEPPKEKSIGSFVGGVIGAYFAGPYGKPMGWSSGAVGGYCNPTIQEAPAKAGE